MKKVLVNLVMFVAVLINIAGAAHVFLYWMGEMPTQTIIATVVLYAIPLILLLRLRAYIESPPARKPKERRQKVQQAAPVPQAPAPMPSAPQRPPERRIANPPTVGQVQPALAPQRASMTPELRRFVVKGESVIAENSNLRGET